ncbi:MAG: tetratricopeptide repeat protein [Pseudomonadota bacterium]
MRFWRSAVLAVAMTGLGLSLSLQPRDALADEGAGQVALAEGRYGDAAQAFSQAFDAGDPDAAFFLGRMTELGLGTEPDPVGAAKFYMAAAEAGSAPAQNRLGLMFLKGESPMLQDYAKARELLCEAAESGDKNGAFNCAVVLEGGLGGDVDKAGAHRFHEVAAEQGHIGAMNALAIALITGEHLPRDFDRAIALLSRTAAQGNPVGLHALGQAYAVAIGVPRDLEKAHAYFNLAAARGHPAAGEARARLEAEMSAEQVTRAQTVAREWRAVPDPGDLAGDVGGGALADSGGAE